MHPVAKAALIVAAEVVGVVVGGVVLEHIVRTMDAGRFHIGRWYWRPGGRPLPGQEVTGGLAPTPSQPKPPPGVGRIPGVTTWT